MTLQESTENMERRVTEIKDLYVRYANQKPDFYQDVKPYIDQLSEESDQWRELALQWVKDKKPSFVHPINIENAHDNLKNIALQAFFHDVKEKRFMELTEAVVYTLSTIKAEC